MPDLLQPHHVRFVDALIDAGVRFVVIGGVAVRFHCRERVAADLDLFIERSQENIDRLIEVRREIGVDPSNRARLLDQGSAYIKLREHGIDLLTDPPGLVFDEAFAAAETYSQDGIDVPIVSRLHILQHKQAVIAEGSGVNKDQADVAMLLAASPGS